MTKRAIMRHPIYRLLTARLAIIEADIDGSSAWFYGDRTPIAESIIRAWAADHTNSVTIAPCAGGFVVDHKKKFESVVTWYPKYDSDGDAFLRTTAAVDEAFEATRQEVSS